MRYFIGFMIALGLLFVLIFLLFHGGKPSTTKNGRTLQSYASTSAQAQLTIDGPINADQLHQAVKITVESNAITYQQIQGYEGNVVNTQTFANNNNGYANFLFALAHAGFTRGDNSASLRDERGYCPLGDRYVFEFIQDGQDLQRYWATSCGGLSSYRGSLFLTLDLFQAQVPGYSQLTRNIRF